LEVERRAAKRRQATKDEEQQNPSFALALDRMERAIQENVDAVFEEDADWSWAKLALKVTHNQSMTMDEGTAWRREIRKETRKANPLLTCEELKPHFHGAMIRAAYEWHKNDLQRIKDSLLSSSLTAKKKEDDLLVRGPSQSALLEEFSSSLTAKRTEDILAEVRRANPNATAKDFGAAYRAFKVQAALVWHRNRAHEGKHSSLPLAGTAKPTAPLSLEAQPKSDASTTVRYYLSLTKEERTPVFEATKLTNPDADATAFNKSLQNCFMESRQLEKGHQSGTELGSSGFLSCF
jgi:hypothetical protein